MRVNASALFLRGIRDNFWATYQASEKSVDSRLSKIMDLGISSDKASEAFGYAQSAPVARFWDKGAGIPTASFLTNSFQVRSWKWGVAVEIAEEDVEDDQTHKIMSRVYESAVSFAMLKERLFYWLFTGGATSDAIQLQPSVPLAPDGAAWFAKNDGNGNARFQVATTAAGGGNVRNSSGVGSAAAVIADTFGALAQIAAYKNTEGQPYWAPDQIMREVVAIFGSQNLLNFVSAFQQLFVVSSSGNAAPSNVKIDAGLKIVPIPNPRITSNSWAIGATDAPYKAPFWLERSAPKEVLADSGNSDFAREYDVRKFYVRARGGVGLALPTMWCGVQ